MDSSVKTKRKHRKEQKQRKRLEKKLQHVAIKEGLTAPSGNDESAKAAKRKEQKRRKKQEKIEQKLNKKKNVRLPSKDKLGTPNSISGEKGHKDKEELNNDIDAGDELPNPKRRKLNEGKKSLKSSQAQQKQAKTNINAPSTQNSDIPNTPKSNKKSSQVEKKMTSPIIHEGRFVFSKFDFLDTTTGSMIKDKFSMNQKGKDYKTLLERVKSKKDKIEEVRKVDKKKAKDLENKYEWKAALARAKGEKVKDDEQMLKKALKRKEYKKKKIKKNWEERTEKVTKKMDQKKKKRTENIRKMKQGRIDKKIKKAKKKGRLFSGF